MFSVIPYPHRRFPNPPGPSYYSQPQLPNTLPGLGINQQSPSGQQPRGSVPPHDQQHSTQSQGFMSSGAQPYDRDLELQEAREREMEQRRRQDAQDREREQHRTPQQSHAEPITLHQPVAQRSSAHAPNGLLNMAAAGGPGPAAPQNVYNPLGPQFERIPNVVTGPSSNPTQTASAIFAPGSGAPQGVPPVTPGQQPILNVSPKTSFDLWALRSLNRRNHPPFRVHRVRFGRRVYLFPRCPVFADCALEQDALSYLDQVKVQFAPEPHVYNQFLDIMKDFKSQAIDTPGVINRVSQLFRGHSGLIRGFNTFLPPGYRIECSSDGDPNKIRVTTPLGTVVDTLTRSDEAPGPDMTGTEDRGEPRGPYRAGFSDHARADEASDSLLSPSQRVHGLGGYATAAGRGVSPMPAGGVAGEARFGANANLSAHQQEQQGVSQLQAATAVAGESGGPGLSPLVGTATPMGAALGTQGEKRGPVEFNHAISYVNKIKNRFAAQPEIYKQFLEILQTYQRESKPIHDVYKQVTSLFEGAQDLLDDFKQFLPESAAHAKAQANAREAGEMTQLSDVRSGAGYTAAAHQTPRAEQRIPPTGQFTVTPGLSTNGKRKRGDPRQSSAIPAPEYGATTSKNGFTANKRIKPPAAQVNAKYQAPVDAPDVTPSLVPAAPVPWAPTTSTAATPDELQFFERVKKHVGTKQSMTEFLKICNLYSQDLIDRNSLVFRVHNFLGNSPDLFGYFKDFVQFDENDLVIENRARPPTGRVNLNNCRSLGQSYRQIPKRERNKACSGRDDLCNSVLNDDWVSHPTWASEDSGFIAHRKNNHEEALHRIEEERHDYDHHISNVDRSIQILEPLAHSLNLISSEEQPNWQLPPDFAGQSLPIYRKVLAKLYGRDIARQIVTQTYTKPANVIPVILNRCKQIRESWKASQREWEKVWRDQTQRAFWRSLDHQGVNVKVQDKRQFQAKTLQTEIQIKYEEQKRARLGGFRKVPHIQMVQKANDREVIVDASNLLLCYAESQHSVDVPRLYPLVKEFIPTFFGLSRDWFQEKMEEGGILGSSAEDDEDVEMSESSNGSKAAKPKGSDLRKKLLEKKTGKGKGDPEESNASESHPGSPKSAVDAETGTATEDESGEDTISKPWTRHTQEASKGKKYDPNAKYTRNTFNLYGNQSIYCFFRMFLILYERLSNLKNNESAVHETVARAGSTKPSDKLHMNEKRPEDFFSDTSKSANYYAQMLGKLQAIARTPSLDSTDMSNLEEVLRRFYLQTGWMLYTFDKLMSALVRFAIAIASGDSKDNSFRIIDMFNKDRKKRESTQQDELQYRKNSERLIKEGDVYRITYVSGLICYDLLPPIVLLNEVGGLTLQ